MGFSFVGARNAYMRYRDEKREDELYNRELNDRRQNSLLELALHKEKSRASARSDKDYQDAARNALRLEQRLDSLDLDEDTEAYYATMLTDPLAANEFMSFIEDQERNYDTVIDLRDAPSLFKITKMGNVPVQKRMDYVSQILNTDLSNKEEYFRLANEINSIQTVPGRTVLTDTTPGAKVNKSRSLKTEEDQQKALGIIAISRARGYVRMMGADTQNQKVLQTQTALDNMKATGEGSEAIRAGALDDLFNMYMSPEDLYDLEQDSPAFKGFMDSTYGRELVETYSYPPVNELDPNVRGFISALQRDPSPQNIRMFELRYGPGSSRRFLGG